MRFFRGLLVTAMMFGATLDAACAQVGTVRSGLRTAQSRKNAGKTTVYVEILTGKQGVGLKAQQWRRTFEQIGFPVRIRRSILDEKTEIKERKLGRLRQVTAIGRLDRSGKLIFPGRSFSPTEGTKLRENLGMDSFCLAELTVRLEDETGIDVFADGLIDTVGEVLHRLGADA